MDHAKCPRCGLNNWPGAEACDRCSAPLGEGPAEAPEVPSAEVAGAPPPDLPPLNLGQDVTSGSRGLKLFMAVVLVVVLAGAGWVLYRRLADSPRGRRLAGLLRRDLTPPSADERTRDTLLAYLSQPGFAGSLVVYQVLGPARLELLHVTDREVYFSVPAQEQSGEAFEAVIARFVVDPQKIVLGKLDEEAGRLRIGDYSLLRSEEKHFFFKTRVDNIRFDPATVLRFPFGSITYTVDMRELEDFISNKSIFGGRVTARTGQSRGGRPVVFANHGALVARPGESSLLRLVGELTRDLPAEGARAREARVQRVLDFVSREISYDMQEATYNFEMLKRPNEVLMSGQSDCSNKAILLGSLLEQLGEDYLFVYTPDHITVAVRRGDFPADNGLTLDWEGQTWLIAEGTAPGFRIGLDRVEDEARFKQFRHVQRPRERDAIFDLSTGRQLSFQ